MLFTAISALDMQHVPIPKNTGKLAAMLICFQYC